jgi:polysaccharide deacetylase
MFNPFSLALALVLLLAIPSEWTVASDRTERSVGKQLHTLPPPPKEGRFDMSYERVWPEEPGQAHICLWADDKYAAVSITIDDNCQPDHDWWIEQGEQYGFRFTWFVITGSIGQPTKSFSGKWDDFRRLRELGHDVQSHTVSHHKDDADRPDEEVRAEYRDSQKHIEEMVPDTRAVCMAYPWGSGKDAIASEYYIACRGVVGAPNRADRINYMRTGSCNIHPDTVDMLLTGKHPSVHWLNRPTYRRAWLAPVYHYVRHGRTAEEKDANQARVAAQLAHLASRKDDIWVGLFREVVCYGMQRDTARLDVTKNTREEIRFSLTDDMDDTLFVYPLTVKIRLPDEWSSVAATQDGDSTGARLVEYEEGRYALVQAVPDRGEVRVIRAAGAD